MLSSYTNPEIIVYKKKEEMSNISKENSDMKNNDMVLLNSSSADDEKERIRKILMSTVEAMENIDRKYEEKIRRECTLRNNKFIVYK